MKVGGFETDMGAALATRLLPGAATFLALVVVCAAAARRISSNDALK